MIVIYGTASSGKSNIAEQFAVNEAAKRRSPLVYIATMESSSEAAKKRIRKHRQQREGKGFYTIEEPDRLSATYFSVIGKTVLLECVSNYCANVLFKELGDKPATKEDIKRIKDYVVSGIMKVSENAMELIVVTNDIFCDGTVYDDWTRGYMKLLAEVNYELAKNCDEFYEVINGVAVKYENN